MAGWKLRYARNTLYTRSKALKRILRDLDPLLGGQQLHRCVPRIAQPPAKQSTVSHEQRQQLLAVCPAWLRLFILLCADVALRFDEARNARLADYNPEKKELTVTTKGGFSRTFAVTAEIAAHLAAIPHEVSKDTPIIHAIAGYPLKKGAVRTAFKRFRARAGLPDTLNPHDFRRTLATAVYDQTKDIRLVQQLLGHQTLHATARYIVDREPERLRSLVESLKPPTEMKQ